MNIQFTGKTAKQFGTFVCRQLRRSCVIDLNKKTGDDRLVALVWHIEFFNRNQYFVPGNPFDAAMYGLNHAVVTLRTSTDAYCAITSMDTRHMCELVFELAKNVEYGQYGSYLNEKFALKN